MMYRIALPAVTLTAVLFAALTSSVWGKCQFPQFLQKDDAWVGDYKYGLLVAYVKGDRIQLTQSEEGGTSVSFTRECVQQEPGGKYLIRHEELKQRAVYRCIQFFKRGDRVVQIRASNYSRILSSEICAEKTMQFDPYPWVQMRESSNSTTSCPFIGGYNMWMYYPLPNNSLVCSNSLMLMRMESECEQGGGIVFDFRSEACVPRGLPRTPIQQAHCVTHWTQEDYTFIILQHATDDKSWWCLRISDALSELKSAYLWLGVVCDMTKTPSLDVSSNYLRLVFYSRIFSSTCEDELEVCEEAPHFCKINYKHHCAATCRECQSEKNIGMCTFDEQFRGTWIDSGRNDGGRNEEDKLINVDAYRVRGRDLGQYSCLMLESDIMPEKRVLLELYENGCFPRYACLEMSKVNSSVMKFRLGHRHAWPLWGVSSIKKHICERKNFLMHGDSDSSHAKERPPRLLINTNNTREVHCGLPKQLQNGFSFIEDGRSCGGCIHYSPEQNPRMFSVRPINCSEEGEDPNAEEQHQILYYSCLASFNFYNNTYSVVTKTINFKKGMGHYLAWIFTEDQIKIMTASETFLFEFKRHLSSRDLVARFSIQKNDKVKCRSYQDWPQFSPTPTTTTTTTPHPHLNNGHYKKGDNHHGNGGKHVTYLPDNGGIGVRPEGNELPLATAKTGQSNSQNLHSNEGNGDGGGGGGGGGGLQLKGSSKLFLFLVTSLVLLQSRILSRPLHLFIT